MNLKKRVVITGLGALTAVGEGADSFWKALVEKRTGVAPVSFGENGWRVPGGRVPDFDPEKYVTQRKTLKVMARDIQLAVAGASLAARDAALPPVPSHPERAGIIVGAGVLNHELDELAYSIQSSLAENGKLDLKKFGDEGLGSLFPLWLLKYLPNMPACHISIFLNLQGYNNTLTTGPSAGLQAVGEAFRIIQRGDADVMLAGGAESKLNPVGLSQYETLGVLERGMVIGEGAGFVVLEELEAAKKRSARIYAEITGFGSSSMRGQAIAMKAALAEAGLAPKDVSYLQASGIGLPEEDSRESEAIHDTFNGFHDKLHTGFSKPTIGFTGFASGALDLIVSTLALQNQIVPPALHAKTVPLRTTLNTAMTNSFGFKGQSVSIVTRLYGGR